MTTVIALGGNTILPKGSSGTIQEQKTAIQDTIAQLAPVLEDEDVVFTHGNGPQVGDLLLQTEETQDHVPLDVLVAETQAQIGYLLQQALQNAGIDAATITTQVVVDADDPAFDEYTKPVGPYYTETEAAEKEFETKQVDDSDKPYRRVVPSPEPQRVVETGTVESVLDTGAVPITVGGGGVPVVETADGWDGVEAVVDKDRASATLASALDADTLLILTNVPHADTDFHTDKQSAVEEVSADELQELLDDGEFAEGSMQPKVEAAISFIQDGGEQAIITDPAHAMDALAGEAGTRVHHR